MRDIILDVQLMRVFRLKTRRALRVFLTRNEIPYARLGRRIFVPWSEFQRAIDKRLKVPGLTDRDPARIAGVVSRLKGT